MQVRDFGPMEGPVLLFGGPYSNLQATEALAGLIAGRAAVCTGDIVGYSADPDATASVVRRLGVAAIAGNCERQVASGADDCGCGFEGGSACDLLSRGWYPHAKAQCSAETVAWFRSLPDIGIFQQGTLRYAVIHGGAQENNRFLWPSTDDEVLAEEITAVEAQTGRVDGVIAGHSGIAFHRRVGRHQWINAGVIGLPPHDGRSETRYAVLDAGEVFIERLEYDHATARAAMEAAGLVQGYHLALTSGIWPSEDVLPPELRR